MICGKVQGVYFRQSTRREAERLHIRGHAVNLPDGCVEVLAQGMPPAIEELKAWLQHGPAEARVDSVRELSVPDGMAPIAVGFATRSAL